MTEYIKNTLGADVSEEEFDFPQGMPMYLKNGYSYRMLEINGIRCLMAEPVSFSLASCKKQLDKLTALFGCHAVLCLKSITPYQRKHLTEEHIPFVVEGTQIYLPFLAICLSEKYKREITTEKFSPSSQLVFLYLFYRKEKLTATELSKKIGYTAMSVSRAYAQLTAWGLYHYRVSGRNKYPETDLSDGDMLRMAEKYMISPVTAVYNCKDEASGRLRSGLYALESRSMIGISESDICFADIRKNISICNEGEGVRVECWCYDPKLLSDSEDVDDISLILSLKDDPDERVQSAVEDLRRKYGW